MNEERKQKQKHGIVQRLFAALGVFTILITTLLVFIFEISAIFIAVYAAALAAIAIFALPPPPKSVVARGRRVDVPERVGVHLGHRFCSKSHEVSRSPPVLVEEYPYDAFHAGGRTRARLPRSRGPVIA